MDPVLNNFFLQNNEQPLVAKVTLDYFEQNKANLLPCPTTSPKILLNVVGALIRTPGINMIGRLSCI